MLYFLVIIIPFTAYMVFLIYQNNLLRRDYENIITNLIKISSDLGLNETNSLNELQHDLIVTSNSIKKLENYLTALEDFTAIRKQSVVSNTFKPKQEKLKVLKNRIVKLEKTIQNKVEEIKQPTTAS